ncbi:Asparagine synthetase [glutamine-hydrolyzing] 1 [Methylobacterium crusticola]|uniref:asparagine synthase (glutamine-hydrolyzing) n=1 Tax=Methylobacterium crusticola TaxID=1697972 RepID=A0ABQ4R2M4_9HYPH|nr:Asparagine synthetase [glutamine-hydrolyzing] 1 [Methylobacterium crusticola]
MCGICGIFSLTDGPPVSRAVVAAMSRTLAHRGPDAAGLHVAGGVGLGFRRLSIVDLAGGHQPLANEDGTLRLVCNGEIFNHRELRAELTGRGHRFRTGSDVEVILHLYEEVGDALLDRIDGQFAFALVDGARRRLLLARDPFGVAPLFHARVGDALVFGSEIKAILAHPGVPRRVDLTGLDQVLSLPGLVSPRTMFQGIHGLPPGHRLVAQDGRVASAPYWDMVYPPEAEPPPARSDEAYREETAHVLAGAVRRRLQADVPVGAYLSGGLDSSLVTALMTAETGPVRTFSITFGERLFDERGHQERVAAHLGCRSRAVELGLAAIEDRLDAVVRHAECPVKETYNAASLALSAAARAASVPVVLSGEGADELFAGYVGYRYDAFRRRSGRHAPPPPREAELRRRLWGDASVFYERALAPHEAERAALYAPALRARLGDFAFTGFPLVDPARLRGLHPLHQRSYLDLKLRLGDHLVGDHGDRMLLANAVEGRFPFLDRAVADLARRMPPDLKLRGFTEKHVLKEVARAHLPAEVVEREKFPFQAPGSAYLLRRGSARIAHLLAPETIRRQGYFDPATVAALVRRARSGEAAPGGDNQDDVLLTVLTFGMFLEAFDLPELGP